MMIGHSGPLTQLDIEEFSGRPIWREEISDDEGPTSFFDSNWDSESLSPLPSPILTDIIPFPAEAAAKDDARSDSTCEDTMERRDELIGRMKRDSKAQNDINETTEAGSPTKKVRQSFSTSGRDPEMKKYPSPPRCAPVILTDASKRNFALPPPPYVSTYKKISIPPLHRGRILGRTPYRPPPTTLASPPQLRTFYALPETTQRHQRQQSYEAKPTDRPQPKPQEPTLKGLPFWPVPMLGTRRRGRHEDDTFVLPLGSRTPLTASTLRRLGRSKVSRLKALGICTVEQLATVDVHDYVLARSATTNSKGELASRTLQHWRDAARDYIKTRQACLEKLHNRPPPVSTSTLQVSDSVTVSTTRLPLPQPLCKFTSRQSCLVSSRSGSPTDSTIESTGSTSEPYSFFSSSSSSVLTQHHQQQQQQQQQTDPHHGSFPSHASTRLSSDDDDYTLTTSHSHRPPFQSSATIETSSLSSS